MAKRESRKRMAFILGFMIVSTMIISYAYAPPIVVSVSGRIQANIDYLNYSTDINRVPQTIKTSIENTGSAGCMVKVRADLYKGSSYLKTSWSEIKALEPGEQFLFHNYWIPDVEGNITANIRIYKCHELIDRGQIWFYVSNKTISETANLRVLETKNSEDEINMTLVSNKTLENVVIIPQEQILGWIVEPLKIDRLEKDQEKIVTIKYEASIWHPNNIQFDIITEDGSEYITDVVGLKEQKEMKEMISKCTIIKILLAVIVLLIVYILMLRRKESGKKKKEDKAEDV